MNYNNYFKWIERYYRIPITKELRNTLTEHFGEDLDIYTEQDLYEQSRKHIESFKDKYINHKYYKYRKYL